MAPPRIQVDKHGFPIPAKFEFDPPGTNTRSARAPRPPRSGPGWPRLGFGLLVIAIAVGLVFGPSLKKEAGENIARWRLDQARRVYLQGDLPRALNYADQAVAALPDDPEPYLQRAWYRLEDGQLSASLMDFNRCLELRPELAQAYSGRSRVYQRLGRHEEAISDLTQVIQLEPGWRAEPLNDRAYARAVANIELDAALADIEEAIDREQRFEGLPSPAFLDTRGYILHLLDRQEEALADMNEAIERAQEEKRHLILRAAQMAGDRRADWIEQRLDENLAVMHHHRGLIYEKLGRQEEADADLRLAERLGYNPAAGVF